jgi:glucose dehydrogenase
VATRIRALHRLTQITPKNVKKLKQAWVYRYGAGVVPTGDQGLDFRFEVTPLLIGDAMYILTRITGKGGVESLGDGITP